MYNIKKINGGVSVGVLAASFVGLILLGVGVYKFGNVEFGSRLRENKNLSASIVSFAPDSSNTMLMDNFNKENSLFGSTSGSLTYIDGPDGAGKAIRFSAGSYAREKPINPASYGQNWTEGTIEFWVKPEQFPSSGQQYLMNFNWNSYPNPSAGYLGDISLRSDGKISYQCGWGWNSVPTPTIISNSSIPLNQWSHVAAVWSPSEGTKIYINNNLDAQISQGCASGSNGNIYPWLAGYGGFVGAMDELNINKTARSAPFYSGDPGAAATPLTVTAPNGGEKWQLGSTNTITWTPYDPQTNLNVVPNVEAYLERLVNGNYVTVGKILPVGKASIHWAGEIDRYGNFTEPGDYYIRVINNKTGESDRSDNSFKLVGVDSFVKIVSPNGGERIPLSSSSFSQIQWTSSKDINKVSIALYKNDAFFRWIVKDAPWSGPSYASSDWNPSALVSENEIGGEVFKIYIIGYRSAGGTVEDKSDAPFTIEASATTQAPAIKVLSPNGGERFQQGQKINIKWSTEPDGFESLITLELWTISDTGNLVFRENISGKSGALNTGSYVWDMPVSIQMLGDFKIRAIINKAKEGTEDYSDAPFTITAPEPTPDVKILPLSDGKPLVIGNSYPIQWTGLESSSDTYSVYLVLEGSQPILIDTVIGSLGKFNWVIPRTIPLARGRIRLVGKAMSWEGDLFEIIAPSTKGPTLSINVSDQPPARTIPLGASQVFSRFILDASGSPENVLVSRLPLWLSSDGNPAHLSNCALYDGNQTQLSNVINPTTRGLVLFSLIDRGVPLRRDGDPIMLSLRCGVLSEDAAGATYQWGYNPEAEPAAIGLVSGEAAKNIGPGGSGNPVRVLSLVEESPTEESPLPIYTSLTEDQVQSVLSLLEVFGVDATTIEGVNRALRGLPLTQPTSGSLFPASATTQESQLEETTSSAAPSESEEKFTYTWIRNLAYGLTDDPDVRALQNALLIEGCFTGSVTGNFFELTREGVKCFQEKYNFTSIPDSGYVGPYTREVLNGIYSQ